MRTAQLAHCISNMRVLLALERRQRSVDRVEPNSGTSAGGASAGGPLRTAAAADRLTSKFEPIVRRARATTAFFLPARRVVRTQVRRALPSSAAHGVARAYAVACCACARLQRGKDAAALAARPHVRERRRRREGARRQVTRGQRAATPVRLRAAPFASFASWPNTAVQPRKLPRLTPAAPQPGQRPRERAGAEWRGRGAAARQGGDAQHGCRFGPVLQLVSRHALPLFRMRARGGARCWTL